MSQVSLFCEPSSKGVKGIEILKEIVSLIRKNPRLLNGEVSEDPKELEQDRATVLLILTSGNALVNWAGDIRDEKKENNLFTEHAFVFMNLVQLYEHMYEAYFLTAVPADRKLEILNRLIDEEAATDKFKPTMADGFCFADEKVRWQCQFKKSTKGKASDKEIREIKATTFCQDVDELVKAAGEVSKA